MSVQSFAAATFDSLIFHRRALKRYFALKIVQQPCSGIAEKSGSFSAESRLRRRRK
jgi:hypothetical protein